MNISLSMFYRHVFLFLSDVFSSISMESFSYGFHFVDLAFLQDFEHFLVNFQKAIETISIERFHNF